MGEDSLTCRPSLLMAWDCSRSEAWLAGRGKCWGTGHAAASPEHHRDAGGCYTPTPGAGHQHSQHPACKRPFKGVAKSKEQRPCACPGLAGLAWSMHGDTPLPRSPPWPQVHLVWWLQEHNPAAADVRRPRSCRAYVSARVCAPPQVQPLHGLKHPLFGWEPEPSPRTAGHWWSHGMCAGAGHQCLVQCCCSAAWRCRAEVLQSSLLVVSFLASS